MCTKTPQKDQAGFGHLAILVIIIMVAVIGLVGWQVNRHSKNQQAKQYPEQQRQQNAKTDEKESDVVIHNFGVKSIMEATNFTTQATREYSKSEMKGLYVFGDKLPGNRLNPNFEFSSIKKDADIIAAIDGVIGFIKDQPESKDSEVFLQPKDNSVWQIGYDHITNLQVKKGQTVKVGDKIGTANVQGNGLYRFEFQINKQKGSDGISLCPSNFLASNVKQAVLADLKAVQEKWETIAGIDLYDVASQSPVGCIRQTLTPAEAQGTPEN